MGFDETVNKYYSALAEFVKGNYHPLENVFSHTGDVTLANPFGGIAIGWAAVDKALERQASYIEEGTLSFQNVAKLVSDEFAFLVYIESVNATYNRKKGTEFSVRVTSIFRKEKGIWKLVHRHADSLVDLQTPETILHKKARV